MRFAFIGVLLLAGASLPSFGQTTFGEITGVVTDASGAVVSGATLTVSNPQTNLARTTTTNSAGNYDFPSLLPGTYSVKVELAGFQTQVHSGVELEVQQVARIDFKLDVGQMTQTIEVTGGAPVLNTENAAVGTVIGTQSIVDLPLNGRDFLQLVALSPNVSASFNVNSGSANGGATSRLGGQRANESFSVSGVRRQFNNYTLDGLADTEVNYNAYIFLPSIDALQEFKVQAGIYPAEFGRGVGQITASTKSGTNDYHGVAFEFIRNDAVDARQFAFTSVVPPVLPFRWNNYGFTLGGPLSIPKVFNGKNRLFFMTNYEGFREFQQVEQTYTTIPETMREGNFQSILPSTVILDTLSGNSPATRTPFPNNIIPASRLNPISVALLAYNPLPNVPGAGNSNNFLNLQNNTVFKDQFTGRVDWVESANSSWFSRYSWQNDGGATPSIYLDGNNLQTHVDQGMIANTRILSPTLVNDARFGVDWFHNQNYFQTTNNPAYDVVDQLGLQIGAGWTPLDYGIPQIAVANGISQFGTPTDGPYDLKDVTLDWNDGLSWIHGSHSFKFGVDIRDDRFNTSGNAFARGSFTIGNTATNYGPADFMLGYLSLVLKSVQENVAEMRAISQAYYVTDTWKVRSNLTIDAGLRYEYTPPWSYRNNQEANWEIPYIAYTLAAAAGNPHPTLCRDGAAPSFYANDLAVFNPNIQTGLGCLGNRLVKPDYTNFAPRLGISYEPAKNWVIRAGAGIFYAQDVGQSVYDETRNMAGRLQPAVNTVTENVTWQNPYLLNGNNPCNVSSPYVCISTPGPLAEQYDRRTPYVEQWTASLQRQLTQSTVLEVDYLGSGAHFLQRYHYLNAPQPGDPTTTSSLSRTPWPEIGEIQYIDGDGVATYQSMVAKVTRRFSKGLNFLSAFTWGKAIDDAPEIRAEGQDNADQNPACINPCERGLSQFNQQYRWVTSALYELPFGRGRAFMNRGGVANAIAGGWRLGSILTWGSGFPFGFSTGVNRSGVGIDRPNTVLGQSLSLSNPSPSEWFNIEALSENALGQFGDVGRNVGIGPGIFTWDVSAAKEFHFTEQRYLELRFECFNCSNHPNFAEPSSTLSSNLFNSATGRVIPGSGTFGTITSLRSGIFNRQLQAALKIYF